MDRGERIGGIALFLFGAVTVVLSLRMPIGTFRAAGSGLFPLCQGILLMGLAGVFLVNLLGKVRRRTEEKLPHRITASFRANAKPAAGGGWGIVSQVGQGDCFFLLFEQFCRA